MENHRRHGFTLIELLTVIAIVSILMGITLTALSGVRQSAGKSATQTLIEQLKTAIENYANDFGDYPPSRPKKVGLTGNGINDGIECLVRCLTTTKKNGPYFDFEQAGTVGNLDNDKTKKDGTSSSYTKNDMFELLDHWGRPFVYLHNADYGKKHEMLLPQEDGDPVKAKVTGAMSKKTGQYYSLTSFQLRSVGEDGQDNEGEEDDITSWKK